MNATTPPTLFFENLVYGVHENTGVTSQVLSYGVTCPAVRACTIATDRFVVTASSTPRSLSLGPGAALRSLQSSSILAPSLPTSPVSPRRRVTDRGFFAYGTPTSRPGPGMSGRLPLRTAPSTPRREGCPEHVLFFAGGGIPSWHIINIRMHKKLTNMHIVPKALPTAAVPLTGHGKAFPGPGHKVCQTFFSHDKRTRTYGNHQSF